MFAIIETKGASHIAIYVPHEGAEKTLPALAAMLENNATFINKGWRDVSVIKPAMSIMLGDKFETTDNETAELVINSSKDVIGEDFVIATPEVLISNKKAIEKKDAEISRLGKELAFVKDQLAEYKNRIEALASQDAE